MDRVIIGAGPAQAVGDDRGQRHAGDLAGDRPVRHWCAQLPAVAGLCPAMARAGLGGGRRERDRAAAGTAALASGGAGAGCAGEAAGPGPGVRHRAGPQDRPRRAHAIIMVALRDKRLRELTADPGLTVLRLLRPP